jgi:hypothetical protein
MMGSGGKSSRGSGHRGSKRSATLANLARQDPDKKEGKRPKDGGDRKDGGGGGTPIPAPAAVLPEFMDTEEVLERLKQIGIKYPELSGTCSEMQEKHLKRTKLRNDTPTALSNAKKTVEVFQSRMDELIALAPVDEEIDKLFTELNKKEKFTNAFSTKKRKTINRGILAGHTFRGEHTVLSAVYTRISQVTDILVDQQRLLGMRFWTEGGWQCYRPEILNDEAVLKLTLERDIKPRADKLAQKIEALLNTTSIPLPGSRADMKKFARPQQKFTTAHIVQG